MENCYDSELIYKQQLDKTKSQKIQREVVDFYNKNILAMTFAYGKYNNYLNERNNYVSDDILDISNSDFSNELYDTKILVLTSNKIEEAILLVELSLMNQHTVPCYRMNNKVFHFINYNGISIIHKHTEGTGDEHTRRTINLSTKIFNPTYIILLGVCYGVDSKKNKLGDVILSNEICGYRVNFRDSQTEEIVIEPETEFLKKPSSEMIDKLSGILSYSTIKNSTYPESIDTNRLISPSLGKILSANSLMSSKLVKEAIISKLGNARPRAICGEMEACGIFKSNYYEENCFDKWIVIKSICDWGEGKNLLSINEDENEKIKDSLQAFAMINSWEVFRFFLDKKCF